MAARKFFKKRKVQDAQRANTTNAKRESGGTERRGPRLKRQSEETLSKGTDDSCGYKKEKRESNTKKYAAVLRIGKRT